MADTTTETTVRSTGFSFLNRIFNIAPSQWLRVSECWIITFLFKLGSAIGWTILTAVFVAQLGIAFLPTLFVVNAFLIMVSTFFFERLITRFKREVLMVLMILLGAICLFFGAILYERSFMAFFILIIFAESVFLAQFNVFLPIFVGDRFTPLESQSTFPFIESGETIGGIIGGVVVGLFADKVNIPWFMYLWIGFLACVVCAFAITSFLRRTLPPLPFRVNKSTKEPHRGVAKKIFENIKKIPFLKGIIVVILLQWVFMNILEFQFTKAVEQSATGKSEMTLAYHEVPSLAVIGAVSTIASSVVVDPAMVNKNLTTNARSFESQALTPEQQANFAKQLGSLKGLFYAIALVAQILLASRLINSLGIVGSLILHPIIMLMSLIWMFFKFGLVSTVTARTNFEFTNVIHKNAYFTSHYAFPKSIRDQAAEFLEGVVRPMGTIVAMLLIVIFQIFLSGSALSFWIHGAMFLIMCGVLLCTARLQNHYTRVTKDQLFSDIPYPEKLNAIEILAQRGHKDASLIFIEKLRQGSDESPFVRIKLLAALGQLHDYQTLPELLEALYDTDPEIRLEAAHALMNFRDIGEKFYSQAFSRFRMIEALKEVFRHEQSTVVRSAIVRLFSLLRQTDIVAFLIEVLHDPDASVRGDCIYTLGLFRDPTTKYYVRPFLDDPNATVLANAVVAMWQFTSYRKILEEKLDALLKSEDTESIKAGLFVLGELPELKRSLLFQFLKNPDPLIQREAAFALTKRGESAGFDILINHCLAVERDEFETMRRFFYRLNAKAKKTVVQLILHYIADHLQHLMNEYGEEASLHEMSPVALEKLRRLYHLVDQHEELFAIENAMRKKL